MTYSKQAGDRILQVNLEDGLRLQSNDGQLLMPIRGSSEMGHQGGHCRQVAHSQMNLLLFTYFSGWSSLVQARDSNWAVEWAVLCFDKVIVCICW